MKGNIAFVCRKNNSVIIEYNKRRPDCLNRGIMTAENPMGKSLGDKENKERNIKLADYLAQAHVEYIKIRGKCNQPENSFFIINPSLDLMEMMAADFKQKAFIYAECRNDDGDLHGDAGYCEVTSHWKYAKTHQKRDILDQSDADKFFTSISSHGRNFKFSIPFFDLLVLEAYASVCRLAYGKDPDTVEAGLRKTTSEAAEYAPKAQWERRGFLYR